MPQYNILLRLEVCEYRDWWLDSMVTVFSDFLKCVVAN